MKHTLAILITALTLFSCDKEDYLIDGGLSIPNVGMSTFTYLQSHDQLDTLALLLDRAGLAGEVDGESTIFAPNDLSIKHYVSAVLTEMRKLDPQAEFSVDDIPVDTLKKYMGGYIFSEKITREDLSKEGTIFTAINGEKRRISLEPSIGSYSDFLSEAPEYVYFTYMGGEEWDDWDTVVDDDKIIIRTSNLQSTNGMIHVLQGTHTLFNYDAD